MAVQASEWTASITMDLVRILHLPTDIKRSKKYHIVNGVLQVELSRHKIGEDPLRNVLYIYYPSNIL